MGEERGRNIWRFRTVRKVGRKSNKRGNKLQSGHHRCEGRNRKGEKAVEGDKKRK